MATKTTVTKGAPTSIDVDRLTKRFSLKVGQEITHEEIEESIGFPRRAYRYKNVLNKWRAYLHSSKGIVLLSIRGFGYKVADDEEKLRVTSGHIEKAHKSQIRAAMVLAVTDRKQLDDEGKELYDRKKTYLWKKKCVKIASSNAERIRQKMIDSF